MKVSDTAGVTVRAYTTRQNMPRVCFDMQFSGKMYQKVWYVSVM